MSVFDWFKSNKNNDDQQKTAFKRNTPPIVDMTEGFVVNDALTKGIYRNTYPGLKLAGFGFNIINVPVSFMGLPVPVVQGESEENKALVEKIVTDRTTEIRAIHTQCHRDGTVWIYPQMINGDLTWRALPDQTVTKVVRDVSSGEIIQVTTEEEIVLRRLQEETEATITRTVIYSEARITTTYQGDSMSPPNTTTINTAGVLPIPFANNADINEIRGHSEYERILADLKNYHDIDLAESTDLAKFKTKMVQTVKDMAAWLSNNGLTAGDLSDLDIAANDFILNLTEETTEFIFASDAINGYEQKLRTIFHKLVELSGIPEIAWGLKTEGNLASVEENMAILMNFCQDKQEQKIEPYTTLINASIRLMTMAGQMPEIGPVEITWDALEATSEQTKSVIFRNYAESISRLIDQAGMTREQLFRFWKITFPSITEEEFDQWSDGLRDMASHRSDTHATPEQRLLAQGLIEE